MAGVVNGRISMMDDITSKHQDGINRMMKKEYVKLHCFIGEHHVAPNVYKEHDKVVQKLKEEIRVLADIVVEARKLAESVLRKAGRL